MRGELRKEGVTKLVFWFHRATILPSSRPRNVAQGPMGEAHFQAAIPVNRRLLYIGCPLFLFSLERERLDSFPNWRQMAGAFVKMLPACLSLYVSPKLYTEVATPPTTTTSTNSSSFRNRPRPFPLFDASSTLTEVQLSNRSNVCFMGQVFSLSFSTLHDLS